VTTTSLDVYDSLGLKHSVTVQAWKTSATTWDYKIDPSSLNYDSTQPYSFGPGSASSPAAAATPWQFTFKADGTIDTASSNIPAISFTPQGNGNPVSIKLDPGSGSTGLTSYVAGTTALLRNQDGYASGILSSITVDTNGVVIGSFTNGTNETLAQVALADFNNPEGLQKMGDNMYTVSANSGNAVVGYSGRETASTIASGALEMSNVDLAQEFTDMIIAQRGFQANSKMITTIDDMLQQLVDMKR
jgi:flagellar hook protein FlgE